MKTVLSALLIMLWAAVAVAEETPADRYRELVRAEMEKRTGAIKQRLAEVDTKLKKTAPLNRKPLFFERKQLKAALQQAERSEPTLLLNLDELKPGAIGVLRNFYYARLPNAPPRGPNDPLDNSDLTTQIDPNNALTVEIDTIVGDREMIVEAVAKPFVSQGGEVVEVVVDKDGRVVRPPGKEGKDLSRITIRGLNTQGLAAGRSMDIPLTQFFEVDKDYTLTAVDINAK